MSMTAHLIFDPTSLSDSANVGANVRAGDDGTLIGHVADALKVSVENASLVVTATDLDIRDLTAVSDSVQAWAFDGTGNPITSTTGWLDVNIAAGSVNADMDGVYDAGTNTDPDNIGMIAHVRNAAPGDAQQTFRSTGGAASSDNVVAANVFGLDVNSFLMGYDGTNWDRLSATGGILNVNISSGSVTVSDAALANTAVTSGATVAGVLEASVVASALSNRKYLFYANNDSHAVYIGPTGVTTATGFPIYPGGAIEMRAGAAIALKVISGSAAQNTRYLELS